MQDLATGKNLSTGRQVKANSIAVWKYGKFGHVAYVERVENGKVYFTEANWDTFKDTNYGGGYDGKEKNLTVSAFETRGKYQIVGYIYLDGVSTLPINMLSSLALSCPSSVNENSTGVCSAKAYYSNGTSKSVNPSWGDNSSALSVSGSGNISTSGVSSDTSVTITGSYNESGKSVQGTAKVVVKDIPDWTGKNPNGTVCEKDGRTVASKAGKNGTLELRWSDTCKVNWVRMTSKSSSYATSVTVQRSSDGRTYTNSGKGTIWTNMVYAPNIKVCASGKVNGESISGVCR